MDIDIVKDDNRFVSRACALIFNKDISKILLFKVEDGRDFYLLPGGRIRFNESSIETIKREIIEEIGYDLDFEFCSIQENFILKKGKKITQYGFCYKAIYNEEIKNEIFTCKDNKNQRFYWVNLKDINNYKILPESVYDLINNSNKITHSIEKMTK